MQYSEGLRPTPSSFSRTVFILTEAQGTQKEAGRSAHARFRPSACVFSKNELRLPPNLFMPGLVVAIKHAK